MLRIPQLTDSELAALTLPLLAIVGGQDVLLDSRDTRDRLTRLVPHAEVAYLEEGYHFLPDQTSRVLEFLERTEPATVMPPEQSPRT